jgi:hypothetical protein
MNLLIKSFRKSSLWCLYHDKLEVSVYKTIKNSLQNLLFLLGATPIAPKLHTTLERRL